MSIATDEQEHSTTEQGTGTVPGAGGGSERKGSSERTLDLDESDSNLNLGWLAAIVATALGAFHLWTGYSGGFRGYQQRSVHLIGAVLILGLIAFRQVSGRAVPVKRLAVGAGLAVWCGLFTYIFLNDTGLLTRTAKLDTPYLIWGGLALLVGLEASRRVIGWTLPLLAFGFSVFVIIARPLSLPLNTWMAPVEPDDFLNTMVFSGKGILGSITAVSAGIVASFLVFGALLSASGGAQSFLNLARFLVGRYRGGPAKVSLVTSAFFGTVSGSSVANVVVDGVFNIPLMKRSGYRASFAAGVEAAASAGGQLVPPVMGAAAFIMAEYTGIPYSDIIVAAIIPTALYYVGLGIAIHLEAMKQRLPAIPKEQLPKIRDFLNRDFFGSFLLPIGVLLFMLYGLDRSLIYASFAASAVVIVYILVAAREPFMARIGRIVGALRQAGIEIARIAAIVIAAQILIGVLGMSGLGARVANELATADIPLSLSLVFLAFVVVLLGFGVPTAAAYVLAASIANPIFGVLGIDPLAGHMFLLYVSVYANVTPPVMPAVYAAAGIARADIMRAGIDASRLLAPAVLVPFAFVLEPSLLLTHGGTMMTIVEVVRVLVGMVSVSAGLAFWLMRPLPVPIGIAMALGGAMLAWPGLVTSIVGAVLIAPALVVAVTSRRTATSDEAGAGVVGIGRSGTTVRTGAEWEQYVGKARQLLREFGAGSDRAVAIGGPVSVSAVATLAASPGIGATVVFVPPDEDPSGLPLSQVAEHGLGAAVMPNDRHSGWESLARPSDIVLSVGGTAATVQDPVEFQLLTTSRQRAAAAGDGAAISQVVLTRGEKAVVTRVGAATDVAYRRAIAAAFGVTPADVVLISAPMETALTAQLVRGTLEVGARLATDEELAFEPGRWFQSVGLGAVTTAFVTNDQLLALVDHCESAGVEIPVSLSAIIHGGGELSEQAKRRAIDVFGPILIEYYAAAEIGGTVITSEEWLEHPGSVGRAWSDHVAIELDGGDGARPDRGRHGRERGPNPESIVIVAVNDDREIGYVTADGEAPALVNGRFVTGDRGYIENGYLYLDRNEQPDGATAATSRSAVSV